MNLPLVSIVMCTYNGGLFLQKQLHSIINQTYQNVEIIISDDASTDDTVSIIKSYLPNSRFNLFIQPKNIGPEKNFEFVLKKAKGEFICCCDQDDVWMPNKIFKLINAINEFPLVYSDSQLIDEDDNILNTKISDLRKMYNGKKTTGFAFSNVVWGHAMMFKADLLPNILPIPKNIPHDIWIAYKACTIGGIKYLDEVLTNYRQHKSTVTTTIAKKSTARNKHKRAEDFNKKINWLEIIRNNATIPEKPFYSVLLKLFLKNKNGFFNFKLFLFLIKNKNELFMFSRKSTISKVIEIIKLCRGEKNDCNNNYIFF